MRPVFFFFLLSSARIAAAADPVLPSATPVEAVDTELAPLPRPSDLPSAQEAAERAVLPGEPVLDLPAEPAVPAVEPDLSSVQPLPGNQTIEMGASKVEAAKRVTRFREAKIRAAARPEISQIKKSAFAAKTERVKRERLRLYYKAMETAMAREGKEVAEDAAQWTLARLVSLSRPRTEPETENYELPKVPPAPTKKDEELLLPGAE